MFYFYVILIGLFGGLSSGLFGVGGGLVFVPLMTLLLGYDIHIAIATSLGVIVPTACAALTRHGIIAGNTQWKTALIIAVFAMVGAWLGSGLSLRLNSVILRRLFSGLLVFMAVRMFFKH